MQRIIMASDRQIHVYELCVVGAGMVGSSAAKYAALSMQNDAKNRDKVLPTVCLIGPSEPTSREGQSIFGAHYDEARITRSTAYDEFWAVLSTRSIARYHQIEKESGIKFYYEVGCLSAGDADISDYITCTYDSSIKLKFNVERLNSSEIRSKFPYLGITSNMTGVWESHNAGYINPRALVAAQQILAERYGCNIIRDIVCSVVRQNISDAGISNIKGDTIMKVTTDEGQVVYSKNVLLATNAFTEGFRQLLPADVHLDMQPVSEAVILAELSVADLEILKSMPSMLIKLSPESESYDSYIMPPIKYPNGKMYLKLGHGPLMHRHLTPEEIINWYTNPAPDDDITKLKSLFSTLFPGICPVSMITGTCVTVDTPTSRPYIDFVTAPTLTDSNSQSDVAVDSHVAVAVGDCGCSAKCSDEYGRLAARLIVSGQWTDEDIKHESVKVKMTTIRNDCVDSARL